jgi:hypothetical protein
MPLQTWRIWFRGTQNQDFEYSFEQDVLIFS